MGFFFSSELKNRQLIKRACATLVISHKLHLSFTQATCCVGSGQQAHCGAAQQPPMAPAQQTASDLHGGHSNSNISSPRMRAFLTQCLCCRKLDHTAPIQLRETCDLLCNPDGPRATQTRWISAISKFQYHPSRYINEHNH